MSTAPNGMPAKRGFVGVLMVFGLMAITLYMAFAFPYTLFHLKQTETTEIKSVIVVGRSGEKSPTPESYFIGEEPPEELHAFGYEQLTNVGKERMYLLGKFLKLRYYHLLLNGDPRAIKVRAADTDRCLESAQALLAGLNPPKGQWIWSSTGEFANWQPKAVHTTPADSDDLLSSDANCFRLEQDKLKWKNSSRYQQLLNEFRHDLQTLRSNTGLEFEDDLEIVSEIDEALRTRKAYKDNIPAWYTSTLANRLTHIADVTSESHFNSPQVQRLYVGRLLHEIAENINTKILVHQQLLATNTANEIEEDPNKESAQEEQKPSDDSNNNNNRLKTRAQREPNMFVYMTDKQRLSALLNSLQIYSSQPTFGSLLLIELHYDPINQLHFLRLFTVSSTSPNTFPEPLRVNPIACLDSVECAPQQFEQNIRHLMLDKASWQEACLDHNTFPTTIAPKPLLPLITDNLTNQSIQQEVTTIVNVPIIEIVSDTPVSTPELSKLNNTQVPAEKLDDSLVVGPTAVDPQSSVSPSHEGRGVEAGSESNSQQEITSSPVIETSSQTALTNETDSDAVATSDSKPEREDESPKGDSSEQESGSKNNKPEMNEAVNQPLSGNHIEEKNDNQRDNSQDMHYSVAGQIDN